MGKPSRKVVCRYCARPAVLVDSSRVYGRSYGMIWFCEPCDAWVGCHKNSRDHAPLGGLANAELRELKKRAHAVFDPLWRAAVEFRGWSKKRARKEAYRWLAGRMNIPIDACHIGYFGPDQCRQAIAICMAPKATREELADA